MCGIVGYIGDEEATPVLINALKNWNTADMILPVLPFWATRDWWSARPRVHSNFLNRK